MLHIWVNSDMAVEAVRQSMHSLVAAPIGQDWFLSLLKVSMLFDESLGMSLDLLRQLNRPGLWNPNGTHHEHPSSYSLLFGKKFNHDSIIYHSLADDTMWELQNGDQLEDYQTPDSLQLNDGHLMFASLGFEHRQRV